MKKILIIGCGSVGQRHATNLAKYNCELHFIDTDLNRLEAATSGYFNSKGYGDLNSALTSDTFDGAIICSPTKYHVEQASLLISHGVIVLLEKPLGMNVAEGRHLEKIIQSFDGKLLLGYTWRWWPPLLKLRELINSKVSGEIKYAHFFMSSHLADWHPWEDYRNFFMAQRDLGGGALLDESHWIDLIIWIFGMPYTVQGKVCNFSNLEIDSDDNVDAYFEYRDLGIHLHLDIYGRPHQKKIHLIAENGSLVWMADPNEIQVYSGDGHLDLISYNCVRNDMFEFELADFYKLLNGEKVNSCGIKEGLYVMSVIDAIRESSRSGSKIFLNNV
jgi:predicted dehydrogenase